MRNLPSHPVLRFIARHDGLSWAGLALGVAQVGAVPVFGIKSVAGIVLLVLGSLFVGAFIGARIALGARTSNVRALELINRYTMSGIRGASCKCTSNLLLKVRAASVDSFVHSKRHASGTIEQITVKYRNLGPDGTKNEAPPPFIVLTRGQVIELPDASGETTLLLRPPAPAKKHDVMEVFTEERAENCFPQDDEHVEKEVLYPTDSLCFVVDLPEETPVENCIALRLAFGMPAEWESVQPVAIDGVIRLQWKAPDAQPGESYRLSWRWGTALGTGPARLASGTE